MTEIYTYPKISGWWYVILIVSDRYQFPRNSYLRNLNMEFISKQHASHKVKQVRYNTKYTMYTTIFLFLLLLNCCDSLYRQSNIIFQSNGYSNVLLAIHDSVTDETILDKIKVSLMSRILFSVRLAKVSFYNFFLLFATNTSWFVTWLIHFRLFFTYYLTNV